MVRLPALLPVDPQMLLTRLFEPGREGLGERAADLPLSILEDPQSQPVVIGLIRAAASEPEAAGLIREVLTTRLLIPVAERVGGEHPELRAGLMASQVVGLAMARHVVGIEPLVTAPREPLVTALAPVFEHYLSDAWVPSEGDDQPESGSPS